MSPADTRIVFFGNERLATGVTTIAPTLQALIAAGYDVVAVVSHHTDSRSRKSRELEIAVVAGEHNIPLLLPAKPAEILAELEALQADIGVLVAYGKIVPQSVIDIFPRGIINIHPSLLPLHRGPIPIESVILDGSTESGVSVMELARAMDAGPVYGQTRVSLSGSETKQELADKLLAEGGSMVVDLLPGILDGSRVPIPQDDAAATYDNLIQKNDGLMDFHKPADQLEREVRAYSDWPKSWAKLHGPGGEMEVIITAAHAVPGNSPDGEPNDLDIVDSAGIMMIETSDGRLCVDRLKPAGKQEMTAQAFMAGYGKLLTSA